MTDDPLTRLDRLVAALDGSSKRIDAYKEASDKRLERMAEVLGVKAETNSAQPKAPEKAVDAIRETRTPSPVYVASAPVKAHRQMYDIICDDCNRHDQVPFAPDPGRVIRCRECQAEWDAGGGGHWAMCSQCDNSVRLARRPVSGQRVLCDRCREERRQRQIERNLGVHTPGVGSSNRYTSNRERKSEFDTMGNRRSWSKADKFSPPH